MSGYQKKGVGDKETDRDGLSAVYCNNKEDGKVTIERKNFSFYLLVVIDDDHDDDDDGEM